MTKESNGKKHGQQTLPSEAVQSGPAEAPNSIKGSAPKTFDVTIKEFCSRLSVKDKRVELIGAFHSEEVRCRRVKDSEANYQKRFEEFVKRPVKS